jgi:hypothetical protein
MASTNSHWYLTSRSFQFFSKILGDIHKSRCTPGINNTGGKFANGINDNGGILAIGTTRVVDTGGKFATSGK